MTSSGDPAREPARDQRDQRDARDVRDDAGAPPETVPIDPQGDDPEHIPDPMPDDLQRTPRADKAFEESHPMDGEAPSG
jgi:hypothetical protein